jgi:hypothetical protein
MNPDITSLRTPESYLHVPELPGEHGGEGLDMNEESRCQYISDNAQFRDRLGLGDPGNSDLIDLALYEVQYTFGAYLNTYAVAEQIRNPEFKRAVRDLARALFNKGHLSADETKAILDKYFEP